MKITTSLIVASLLPLSLWAQADTTIIEKDSIWVSTIQLGINFNQASFSDNWAGGGVNSIALGSLFDYRLRYKKGDWSWNNELELLYGIIKNKDQDMRKSQDRIFFDTKLGHNISEFWNTFLAINFLTQFAPGYRFDKNLPEGKVLISNFMAPGFLTTSIGFEYEPNEHFFLRLSPLAPRLTFVNDPTLYLNVPENYGVQVGEKVRYEILASQILAELNKDITDILNVKSRYMLYANYETLAFNTIDHRLDVTFTAKLTQYINVNIAGILLYDKDQDVDVQFSQVIGIGVLFQK